MKRAAAVVLRELACHFGVTITRGCQIDGSLTPPDRRKSRLPVIYFVSPPPVIFQGPSIGADGKGRKKKCSSYGEAVLRPFSWAVMTSLFNLIFSTVLTFNFRIK